MYNIPTETAKTHEPTGVIEMCLNETYSTVRISKYLFDTAPIQSCLKQGDVLLPMFFSFALEYAIKGSKQTRRDCNLNGTHQLLVYTDVSLFGGNILLQRIAQKLYNSSVRRLSCNVILSSLIRLQCSDSVQLVLQCLDNRDVCVWRCRKLLFLSKSDNPKTAQTHRNTVFLRKVSLRQE